jgi:hypothetical protein
MNIGQLLEFPAVAVDVLDLDDINCAAGTHN